MADRSIRVVLRAEVAGFRQAMNDATSATRRAREEGERATGAMGGMVQSAHQNRAAWDQAGRSLVAFGAIAVGAFALTVKAAMDWETAWTGVLKTVDGTPEQLKAVEDGLRGLARELPISHTELAAVAEAAGQLGIKTNDVVAFTKVMVDLGQTTNLSAEEAATSLARIMNIMGTSAKDVSRMGATIVDLGNNSATTEREILELGTRLAAAGKQAGLSESDIFAFASALTSVGVEAEAGGTAMSKVFTSIADATRDGGAKLELFAQVAGVSAAEFKRSFEQDAAGGITMFVEGMGELAASGQSTTDVFKDLGLTDSRLKRAVLSTGAAAGLLADQVDLASNAWSMNTALLDEAGKRYDTTASKIASAKGSINDAAISMGEAFLPMLTNVADGVSGVADKFGAMPSWVQAGASSLLGAAGAASLAAGAFFLMLPRVIDSAAAFRTLMGRSSGARAGLLNVGRAAGIVAAAMAAMAISSAAVTASVKKIDGGAATKSLLEIADGTKSVDEAFATMFKRGGFQDWFAGNEIDSAAKALETLTAPSVAQNFDNIASSIFSFGQSTSANRVQAEEFFETVDGGLASLVQSGALEEAKAALDGLGIPIERQKELLPGYFDALDAVDAELLLASGSTAKLATETAASAEEAEAAAEAYQKWADTINGASDSFVNAGTAFDAAITKTQEWAQAQADATKTADDSWEDFYDGVTVSADSWIEQLVEQNTALANWQDNLLTITSEIRTQMPADMVAATDQMIDELAQLGPEGAAALQVFRDSNAETRMAIVNAWQGTGLVISDDIAAELDAARTPTVEIDADDTNARAVAADLQNELNNRGLAVPPWAIDANAAPAIGTAGYLQGVIDAKGAAVPDWMIDADTGPAILAADGAVASINDKTASIEVSANTGLATALTEKWMAAFSGKSITVGVRAATGPGGQGGQTFAGGGGVSGPGTGTSDSIPALLSNGEHVLTADDVQKAGGQSGVYRLRQAIQAGNLPAFASGGAVGEAFSDRAARLREWEAAYQRSLSVIGTDQYSGAKAVEEAAERAFEAATKRVERLQAAAADAATQVRRGEVTAQASGGLSGAYSVVDRLSSMAASGDYGAGNAAMLAAAAQVGEKAFKSLYSSAEGIESKLKDARDRVSELGSISSGVASKLTGEFSLTDGLTKQNTNAAGDIWFTQSSIADGAKAKAASIRSFAGKLASLQKMGLSGAVLQEVASLGSVEGGRVADTLLAGGKGEVTSLNAAYADIAKWSGTAGQYVTEGFYKGGLQAANGLVAGLSSQQAAVEKQIADLAKGMENALKIALGIRSPSKVTTAIGAFTGEGLAVGIRSKRRAIAAAARDMAAAAVPDVAAVSAPVWASPMGYGSSGSAGAVQVNANIDKGAMAQALDGVSLTLMVDGSPVRAIVRTEMSTAAVAVSRGY